jgi:serine-aspartate repeat-containing protein C/D/E
MRDTDSDANSDANSDSNSYAYTDSYANGDSNSYAYTDSYGDADTNNPAEIKPDTKATSDTAASPVGRQWRLIGDSS